MGTETTLTLRRPMLASPTKPADWANFKYPLFASPKIDGVRATNVGGKLVSRTLKDIPNAFVRDMLSNKLLDGIDGELCVGKPNDPNLMQQTTSGVMSRSGEPDFTWWVFDDWTYEGGFQERYNSLRRRLADLRDAGYNFPIRVVPHTFIYTFADLQQYEEVVVNKGFEGVMLRDLDGPYKQGRSTLREGYLLKLKRFEDGEAEVLGFVEQFTNNNEATIDERGYTKRSTHKAGKDAAGVLGAIRVRDVLTGCEFEVGTGFTAEQRVNLWEGRRFLIGKVLKYKHFAVGVKDKPRFPTFVGFRDKADM